MVMKSAEGCYNLTHSDAQSLSGQGAADEFFDLRAHLFCVACFLLLGWLCRPLVNHIHSSSPRKHVYQHWQNDEHQNGREQDASDHDQSKWPLNLCADSRR
jgi:hypothetical protein